MPATDALTRCWQRVLERVRGLVDEADCQTWLEPSALVALDNGHATLATPNVLVRQEIEERLRPLLQDVFSRECGYPITLQAVIG